MLGKLVLGLGLVVASLTLGSGGQHAQALSLGNLEVKSNLNQPLSALISLELTASDFSNNQDLARTDWDLDKIQVSLASEAEFKKLGIEMTDFSYFLSQLKFKIINNNAASEKLYIEIISTEIVKQPILKLVVQVSAPRSEFLKAYTILLDPVAL